tara:strand:- start:1637 stop:2380 length:744 start_codon:yes stop_codon:yes gene_type:complete
MKLLLAILALIVFAEAPALAQSEFQPSGDLVMDEGASLTRRGRLNFTGDLVACVDNSGSSRTDCTISEIAPAYLMAGVTLSGSSLGYLQFDTGGTTNEVCHQVDETSAVDLSQDWSAVVGSTGQFQYDGTTTRMFEVQYSGSFYGYQEYQYWHLHLALEHWDGASWTVISRAPDETYGTGIYLLTILKFSVMAQTLLVELDPTDKIRLKLCAQPVAVTSDPAYDIYQKSYGCDGNCNDTRIVVTSVQ